MRLLAPLPCSRTLMLGCYALDVALVGAESDPQHVAVYNSSVLLQRHATNTLRVYLTHLSSFECLEDLLAQTRPCQVLATASLKLRIFRVAPAREPILALDPAGRPCEHVPFQLVVSVKLAPPLAQAMGARAPPISPPPGERPPDPLEAAARQLLAPGGRPGPQADDAPLREIVITRRRRVYADPDQRRLPTAAGIALGMGVYWIVCTAWRALVASSLE